MPNLLSPGDKKFHPTCPIANAPIFLLGQQRLSRLNDNRRKVLLLVLTV